MSRHISYLDKSESTFIDAWSGLDEYHRRVAKVAITRARTQMLLGDIHSAEEQLDRAVWAVEGGSVGLLPKPEPPDFRFIDPTLCRSDQ